eukprot:26189-Pelagomonas_calceolata.AAC.1
MPATGLQGYREQEGLQSKRLTASLFMKEKKFMQTYEKTVHGEWQTTCQEGFLKHFNASMGVDTDN